MPPPNARPVKNSPIGPIPARWTVVRLGDLAVGEGRYGSPAAALDYDADLPRYIRITDIRGDGSLRGDSRASIGVRDASPFRLGEGDLLIARSGATCGKAYLYRPRDGVCAHAGYLIRFELDRKRCEPEFVARVTQTSFYRDWLRGTIREAAQPNVNAAEFASLPVPLPPRSEQRRIVHVLDAQDQVIWAGERVAAKLRDIRVALLDELFRRGAYDVRVLPDGEIRTFRPGGPGHPLPPTRETIVGPLPCHFDVAPVGALLIEVSDDEPPAMRSGPFGSALRKADLATDGVPLLGIDNVGVEQFIARYKRHVPWRLYEELARYHVRPRDVMVTIMGTVGRACVVPDDVGPALSSKHVWTLSFDPERYLPELACAQFNHASWVTEQWRRDEQGGTMAAIRSETLQNTWLPVPPIAEQHRMREALETVRGRHQAELADLAKRRRMRQAIIDDLMTGRVRVPRS